MEPDQEARLKKFLAGRDMIAAGLELEPSLLGSRKMITELLHRRDGQEDWTATAGLRRWQERLLAPLLA